MQKGDWDMILIYTLETGGHGSVHMNPIIICKNEEVAWEWRFNNSGNYSRLYYKEIPYYSGE